MQAILNRLPAWVYVLIQIFFALLLLASAAGKLADMPGFYRVVETYSVFPNQFIPPSAWALVALEAGLAVTLIKGKPREPVAALLFMLHCLYFAWLSLALVRGLTIANCGCFGVYFPRPLTGYTLLEDAFLLLLSGALWRSLHRGR